MAGKKKPGKGGKQAMKPVMPNKGPKQKPGKGH